MTRFEEFANYALFGGVIMLVAFGLALAIKATNVKIEARCIAQGGQVLVTPGEVSRCLLPPTR
jgi:hypothetical protein